MKVNFTLHFAGSLEFTDVVVIPAGFTEGNVTCVEFQAADNDQLDKGNKITVEIVAYTENILISSESSAEVHVVDDDSEWILFKLLLLLC